jgi:hypothetical protein
MRSALKCLHMAENCKAAALAQADDVDRNALFATAGIWRKLATLSGPRPPLVGPPHFPPLEIMPGQTAMPPARLAGSRGGPSEIRKPKRSGRKRRGYAPPEIDWMQVLRQDLGPQRRPSFLVAAILNGGRLSSAPSAPSPSWPCS